MIQGNSQYGVRGVRSPWGFFGGGVKKLRTVRTPDCGWEPAEDTAEWVHRVRDGLWVQEQPSVRAAADAPAGWETIMRAGMAREIRNLQRAMRANQLTLWDAFEPEELMEVQPCVLDDLDGLGGRDGGLELAYDAEVEG